MTGPSVTVHESSRIRRLVVDAVRMLRERLFSKPGPDPQFVVQASEAAVVEALGRANYVHPWLLSYHYEGEDRNLVWFFSDFETYPELPYRQDHVRLYVDEYPEGEVGLACHTEPSSVSHREAHLDGETTSRGPAARRVRVLLDDAGLDYERA